MKKMLLVGAIGAVSLGFSASAFAADMPAKAYPTDPAFNWTGFYIGGNVGGGSSVKRWADFDFTTTTFFDEGRHSATGPMAGGQIGYRWQSASWVFGVEAQYNWANLRGDNVSIDSFDDTNHTRIDSIGLFTAQLGYTVYDTLLYVKGGAMVVTDHYTVTDLTTGILEGTKNETRWGATAGVGVEYAFSQNWTAGIEYNHGFLGTRTMDITDVIAGGVFERERIRQDLDMVTLRLNYKFGGPVVARY